MCVCIYYFCVFLVSFCSCAQMIYLGAAVVLIKYTPISY